MTIRRPSSSWMTLVLLFHFDSLLQNPEYLRNSRKTTNTDCSISLAYPISRVRVVRLSQKFYPINWRHARVKCKLNRVREIFVRSQINTRWCHFAKSVDLLQAIRVRAECHSYGSISSSASPLAIALEGNIAPFQAGYLLCSHITTIKRCYLVSWKRLSIEMFVWNFVFVVFLYIIRFWPTLFCSSSSNAPTEICETVSKWCDIYCN